MPTKIVTVDLGFNSYDVYIGTGLLYHLTECLPFDLLNRRIFIVTDQSVSSYAEAVKATLSEAGVSDIHVKSLESGEQTKSFQTVELVTSWLLENGITRDSMIFAVGGGVIGDVTGFCASIVLRGVPYVQVPTTLLSQVDSSVGGKTGINTNTGKNLIGSFYQPAAVIIDIETLATLPDRELRAGYAEIVKYGLINDSSFFNWLDKNINRIKARDQKALLHVIETSVKAKTQIVQADETEQGTRALLNLGHTFGHALEAAAGYSGRLLHGEAVAMGIVMAFDLSARMGLCSSDDFERVETHLTNAGFLTRASFIQPVLNTDVESLMLLMERDKKVKSGKINFILVNGIGMAFITSEVPPELVRDVIRQSLGGEKSGTSKMGIQGQWKSVLPSQQ